MAEAGPARRDRRAKDGGTRRAVLVSCRVCGAALLSGPDRKLGRCPDCPSDLDEELFERLREWRTPAAPGPTTTAHTAFTRSTPPAPAERRPVPTKAPVQRSGAAPPEIPLLRGASV